MVERSSHAVAEEIRQLREEILALRRRVHAVNERFSIAAPPGWAEEEPMWDESAARPSSLDEG